MQLLAIRDAINAGIGSKALIGGNWNPPGHAAGGLAPAGQLAWFGEKGPELGVPNVSTTVIPHDESMRLLAAAGEGGGRTINVSVVAPSEARDPLGIATELQLVADFYG
jgi:hypothetical protein